jgi:ribulose-5-phosphate 4-epimerase/fuculose-1-phosphate aldolase
MVALEDAGIGVEVPPARRLTLPAGETMRESGGMNHSHMDPAQAGAPVPDAAARGAAADPALIDDLALANRILFREGVLDAFGHVSARHDKSADHFLLARNMAPGLVTSADIVTFDLDGRPVDANGRSVYLERFIHGEIYRARPDVMAIVHSHSPAVVPFGLLRNVPFRAVCHMSGFIGICAPVFEIRDVVGDASDLLITSNELGAALADALGDQNVVLMRGHGSTVVGSNLRQTVYRGVYTEVNAKLQAEVMRLGDYTPLSQGETETTRKTIETQVDRAWGLWSMKAKGEI